MELDLFGWWMISISSSIVFLTLVSLYIYGTRNGKTCETKHSSKLQNFVVNFAFVWVLIGLLLFYISAVKIGSSLIFAIGNIAVEIMLIGYLLVNKTKVEIDETEGPRRQV
jgi:hypothetical protein